MVGTEAILHRGRGIVNRVCRVVGGHYRRLGKSNLVIRLNRGLTLRGQIIFPGGTGGHPNVQGLELERYQLDGLVRDKKTVYRCGTIGNIT